MDERGGKKSLDCRIQYDTEALQKRQYRPIQSNLIEELYAVKFLFSRVESFC